MRESPGWLSTIFRQLREDARELDSHLTADLLRFAADHNAVDLPGFLSVVAELEHRNAEEMYEVLSSLSIYIQRSATADSNVRPRTDIAQLFMRYSVEDPLADKPSK